MGSVTRERIEAVRNFSNRVRADGERLADLIARETGKPLWEARTEWVVIGRQRRCRRPAPHGEEGNSPRGGVAFFPLRMVGRRARQHDVAL